MGWFCRQMSSPLPRLLFTWMKVRILVLSAFQMLKDLVLPGHPAHPATTRTALVVAVFPLGPAPPCVPQPPLSPATSQPPAPLGDGPSLQPPPDGLQCNDLPEPREGGGAGRGLALKALP